MNTDYISEQDVSTKLLAPLFGGVLGYPEKDLLWNVPVVFDLGREKKTKWADLVVSRKGSRVIAVESKKPTEPVQSGLGQVDSYAFALQTRYSVITNGRHFLLRGYYEGNRRINVIDDTVEALRASEWKQLRGLISFANIGEAIKDRENAPTALDEEQITNYRRFFRKIHNAIRDRDKLDPGASFDELSKLLFLRAAEDERAATGSADVILTPDKVEEWAKLGTAEEMVNKWFKAVTGTLFPGVFGDHPIIELSPATLAAILRMMGAFHVKGGDVDVKGRAFEEFLPSQLRGKGLGQYFTPRPIVNFMVGMAGVSIQDVAVDFACGSGGFLIKTFEQMQAGVDQLPAGTLKKIGTSKAEILDGIKGHQIFGVDAEPRAARTAKMNMLMWGDGKQVVRGNALDVKDKSGKPYEPREYSDKVDGSGCTLILANPPFGSKEKDEAILKRYVLGSKGQDRDSEKTEILFIEKGLKLLRPEGRMLIVLPQGLMSGQSNDRVRDFIHGEAEIRAIISLPTHTFVQSGVPTVNTCILYVQKFTKEKKHLYDVRTFGKEPAEVRTLLRTDPDFDYSIFMGTAEYIGYEPSGRAIGGPGELTDLDELLADFEHQEDIARPDVDVFDFASKHYGDRAHRRKDQTVRGTTRGLKTSFTVKLSETVDRLDPPFYLLRYQAGKLIESLAPLGDSIKEAKKKVRPTTDEELDAEYDVLSVSSDGTVTLNERVKGEAFTQKMKRVRKGDIVYNPMRANIGSFGVVPDDLDNGYVSPDYFVFRSLRFDPAFLVTLLRSPFYRMYIDVTSTGSIRDRLYFRDLRTIRVPDVDETEQAAICEAARRADEEAHRLLFRIATAKAETAGRINGLVKTAAAGDTAGKFRRLTEQWKRGRGMSSSLSTVTRHPAYQEIALMGEAVLPYIMAELEREPDFWFPALRKITGENPVPARSAGKLDEMAKAWLEWGRARNVRGER